jgi:hypothetical protein
VIGIGDPLSVVNRTAALTCFAKTSKWRFNQEAKCHAKSGGEASP